MGQQICYIISTDLLEVPLEIVHFKEQGCTVFPLLVNDTDYENILHYSEPKNSEEFFHEFMTHCGYEYLNRKIAAFMSEKRLRNFAMINYGNLVPLVIISLCFSSMDNIISCRGRILKKRAIRN